MNLIFKKLLSSLESHEAEWMISKLPSSMKESMPECNEFHSIEDNIDYIRYIDPSWITFSHLSRKDLSFILSNEDSLLKLYNITGYKLDKRLSKLSKSLLLSMIDMPTPLPFLPSDALNEILPITPDKIKKLITLLGLFDLTHQLKNIISGEDLRKIKSFLSKEEVKFILEIKHSKVKRVYIEKELPTFSGKALRKSLFENGIRRLAGAFHKSPSEVQWYPIHALNREDGNILKALMKTPSPEALSEQLLFTWRSSCC